MVERAPTEWSPDHAKTGNGVTIDSGGTKEVKGFYGWN